jgi:hypothetical protein
VSYVISVQPEVGKMGGLMSESDGGVGVRVRAQDSRGCVDIEVAASDEMARLQTTTQTCAET